MTVDAIKRTVTATKEELRDHRVYMAVRPRLAKGYDLVLRDTPAPKPWNALPVKRADLHDIRNYERAKQRAKEQNKVLWLED